MLGSKLLTTANATFVPSNIAGLLLDIDPSAGIYQDDARTVAVTADGQTVGGVEDQSGAGNHGAQTNASEKPTYKTNIINSLPVLRFDGGDFLNFASLVSNTDTQGAVFAVIKRTGTDTIQSLLSTANETSNNKLFVTNLRQTDSSLYLNINQQNADTSDYVRGNTPIGTDWHIMVWSSDGSSYAYKLDGADEIEAAVTGANSGDWIGDTPSRNNFYLGAIKVQLGTVQYFHGDLARLLYYNQKPNASQIAQLTQHLADTYDLKIVKSEVICDGDSLTRGHGGTIPYPEQLASLLGSGWRTINLGVDSQKITDMQSDAITQVDRARKTTLTKQMITVWGGTNDLYFGGSEATLQANYQTYCANRQTAGFQVVTTTMLPRSDASTPGTFETDRQAFNTWLRANYATFADVLADVAADTRIGEAGDETNRTYYAGDNVHLNDTGYGIVAGIVRTAISGL